MGTSNRLQAGESYAYVSWSSPTLQGRKKACASLPPPCRRRATWPLVPRSLVAAALYVVRHRVVGDARRTESVADPGLMPRDTRGVKINEGHVLPKPWQNHHRSGRSHCAASERRPSHALGNPGLVGTKRWCWLRLWRQDSRWCGGLCERRQAMKDAHVRFVRDVRIAGLVAWCGSRLCCAAVQ